MHKINIKGFTLIEMVIVVGILALLVIMVVTVLNPIQQLQKARDTQRKEDLAQIQRALESYYQDNGSYPINTAGYQISTGNGTTAVAWGTRWAGTGNVVYMNQLPKDPGSAKYIYYSANCANNLSSGQCYYLYASLERGAKDSQACVGNLCKQPAGAGAPNVISACNGKCNYGVTSPDNTP